MSDVASPRVLILGAGYCGLAAAIELSKSGTPFVLVEKQPEVGGLSKTVDVANTAFELGPHIYFNKDREVEAFWKGLIGDRLETHYRNTRIYYRGRYISSPLRPLDAVVKIGLLDSFAIFASFLAAKFRSRPVSSAEDWVISNFGNQLFQRFFKVYNEKIWGLPSSEISPNWAGQRIKSSLASMLWRSLLRDQRFIVKTFSFPKGGSKVIYGAQEALIAADPNGELRLNCQPLRIDRKADAFYATFDEHSGPERFSHVISTLHLSDLSELLNFENKDATSLEAELNQLRYRNLILVNAVFPRQSIVSMKEHWIDVHDPNVKALRVTNFSNYSSDKSSPNIALGIEYNCFCEDEIWTIPDQQIAELARADLKRMGIVELPPAAIDIMRIEKAYPIYFRDYEVHTSRIFEEFSKVSGLILAGRNAMYKWNNMHHSVKTGQMAARNVLGANCDLSAVRGNVTIGKDSD